MPTTTRRNFLKHSIAAGITFGIPRIAFSAERSSANETVRLAVVGLGSTTAIGGVGGRGHQLIAQLRNVPGTRIAALCDVDETHLDRELKPFKDRGETITAYRDLRKVFDDPSIDAVVIAMPNHWHALATIWACQAGKDVYVEKPFSYNLWEGRQMVAAARKHARMVQVGTQNRSSGLLRRTFDELRGGQLGPIRFAHALVYRARDGIGNVTGPTPVPGSVDYDLWCGPSKKGPLMRKQLHYEWHWFWDTGNGEVGNNGIHVMDLCRWALGQNQAPPRGIGIGGRFAFNDCGETANTHIALLDYSPAPLICEVRNVRTADGAEAMGSFRGQNRGIVIDCAGGYFAGDASGGALFDHQGKKIKDITDDGGAKRLEASHLTNFITAVRNRKSSELACEALEGHRSAACCHLPNISYRLGQKTATDDIRASIRDNSEMSDAFERCREYLQRNGVDLKATPAVLGPWVTLDPTQERFVGDFAKEAETLAHRQYRQPFVVPTIA